MNKNRQLIILLAFSKCLFASDEQINKDSYRFFYEFAEVSIQDRYAIDFLIDKFEQSSLRKIESQNIIDIDQGLRMANAASVQGLIVGYAMTMHRLQLHIHRQDYENVGGVFASVEPEVAQQSVRCALRNAIHMGRFGQVFDNEQDISDDFIRIIKDVSERFEKLQCIFMGSIKRTKALRPDCCVTH